MTEITDASLDRYFREGTSIEGVKALLRAGAVYVNGAAVPGSERGAEDFVINDFPSLWKTGEGTWAYSVHKLYSADDLSFEEASLGFIQGISKMRGLDIRLYSADGVYADRMEVLIKESTLVNSMEKTGDTVRIGRYEFALATNEIRPDVNNISFPAANVDPNLRVGDIALYWCENGVWHIQQAVAAAGTLTQGSGEEKFIPHRAFPSGLSRDHVEHGDGLSHRLHPRRRCARGARGGARKRGGDRKGACRQHRWQRHGSVGALDDRGGPRRGKGGACGFLRLRAGPRPRRL